MAFWDSLKDAIAAAITSNANNEITGAVLRGLLNNTVVPQLGALQYKGIAVPATDPGTPTGTAFYICSTSGTYANFSGIVIADEIAVLRWNGLAWEKDVFFEIAEQTGAVTKAYVDAADNALREYIDSFTGGGTQTQKIYAFSSGYIGGLSFKPYGDWEINGSRFQLQVDPAITADPADAIYLRIDLILLHDDGTITIKKGTPAENPTEPDYDTQTAINATPIYIPAGSTTPEEVEVAQIYDENLGEAGGEWNVTKSHSTVTLDSTERFKTGTKSIKMLNPARFTQISLAPPGSEDLPAGTINEVKLEIYMETALPVGVNPFRISFTSWSESRRGRPSLVVRDLPELTAYGFNPALTGVWQFVSLPLNDTTLSLSSLRMRVLTDELYTCFVDNITYNDGSMPVGGIEYATVPFVEQRVAETLEEAKSYSDSLHAGEGEVVPVATSRAFLDTDHKKILMISSGVTLTMPSSGLRNNWSTDIDVLSTGAATIDDDAGGVVLDFPFGKVLEADKMATIYRKGSANEYRGKGEFIE